MGEMNVKPVLWSLGFLLLASCSSPSVPEASDLETSIVETERPAPQTLEDRFAILALDCVHREYPNKISHVLQSDADSQPPRSLTPVFYGCFDWHSSVHGHWVLARLLRPRPQRPNLPQSLHLHRLWLLLRNQSFSSRSSCRRSEPPSC